MDGISQALLFAWFYASARLMGWTLVDPMLSRLPLFLRVLLAGSLAAMLMPWGEAASLPDPFSGAGLVMVMREALLGAGMGLMVRLLFSIMEAALGWLGQVTGRNLYQPWLADYAPDDASLRQMGFWLAGLAFFSANGHLLVVQALQHSLSVLPAGSLPEREGARTLLEAGNMIFSTGLQLALPLILLALLAQGVFAVVSRLLPGIDAWSIGLNLGAVTLLGALAVGVPIMLTLFVRVMDDLPVLLSAFPAIK
ncbi:MAG: flagellar biosynthetic protein FliR [Thiobacillaceae bacterium]